MRTTHLVLAAAFLSFTGTGCYGCTKISSGHVGVKTNNCSGGGINQSPLGIGWHTEGPCEDIVEFKVFQQTIVRDGEHAISATSSEGLPIKLDVAMSYTVDGSKAPAIFGKYRKDLEHIESTFIVQTLREAIQDKFSKYTAEQLYSDKKEAVRKEIFDHLTSKTGILAKDGFHVEQFTISQMIPPSEVLNAIKGKVAMIQEAQRTEQEVRKKKALAEQEMVAAKTRAESIKLNADAEAYANSKITNSINPVLVEYMKVQKWDGKLPQVSGGASPMISLK